MLMQSRCFSRSLHKIDILVRLWISMWIEWKSCEKGRNNRLNSTFISIALSVKNNRNFEIRLASISYDTHSVIKIMESKNCGKSRVT